MKDIGKKIRELREALGMTQEELAHKVGYKSRVSINKIELQRDVPLNKLNLIAKALGTTPSALAGWEEDEKYEELLSAMVKNKRIENIASYDPSILTFVEILPLLKEEQIKELIHMAEYYLYQNSKEDNQ